MPVKYDSLLPDEKDESVTDATESLEDIEVNVSEDVEVSEKS